LKLRNQRLNQFLLMPGIMPTIVTLIEADKNKEDAGIKYRYMVCRNLEPLVILSRLLKP